MKNFRFFVRKGREDNRERKWSIVLFIIKFIFCFFCLKVLLDNKYELFLRNLFYFLEFGYYFIYIIYCVKGEYYYKYVCYCL